MNGEESLSLPRTLCTESQEGKQDLAFIGVILGNREIDSDKYLFCLNVCVSWLLLYTEVTLCHANSIYICLKYWEGPDLGIGAFAAYYFQACGLQNYEAGSMSSEKDVSSLPPSPENAGKSTASPETWRLLKERAKDKEGSLQDLDSPVPLH